MLRGPKSSKFLCVLLFEQEKLAASGKAHVIFSYFDTNTNVYRPNHALKCQVTVKKKEKKEMIQLIP